MSPSLGTTDRVARERVDAARALLARPILTRASDPDLLALVRLHAQALRRAFGEYLGYTLVVETGFARLIKGPLDAAAAARPARRADGQNFSPATYVFLALLCAALLAPDTGEQILISSLIEQVRADAVTLGIDITDQLPDRRRLVNALSLLVSWGVVEETDGTAAGWSERRDEALLTVNRALLRTCSPGRCSPPTHPGTRGRSTNSLPNSHVGPCAANSWRTRSCAAKTSPTPSRTSCRANAPN